MRNVILLAVLLLFSSSWAVVSDAELNRDIGVELIKTTPSVVYDNTDFVAYLVFTNDGSQSHTISFSVQGSSMFSHTGPESLYYSDIKLEPGESINYEINVFAKELVLAKNPLKIAVREGTASAVKTVFVDGRLDKKYIDLSIGEVETVSEDEVAFDLMLSPSEDFFNVHLDFGISQLPLMIKGDDNVKIIPYLYEDTTIRMSVVADESAGSGIYQVLVNTTANDAFSNEYNSLTYLPLNLKFSDEVALGQVTSTPQTLRRDTKNNVIEVEIANMGNDAIDNAEATLVLDVEGFDPTFFGSDSYFLGTVASDERENAIFKFDIDDSVPSGSYEAALVLTYYHVGEEKQKSFPVSINVQRLPFFIVNQTTNEKDGDDYITFYVTNTGDECTDVEVTGLTKSLPITYKQNTDKAAKLDEGETKEFKLQFTFNDLAVAKEYGIPVRVRCVHNQEPIIQEEEVFVMSSGKEENFLPFVLIGGFLLVLVLLVGKYFFRPKKVEQ